MLGIPALQKLTYTPITYRGYHDVPLYFAVAHLEKIWVFDSPFDEQLDDYTPDYSVYTLPAKPDQQVIDFESVLSNSLDSCEYAGKVAKKHCRFRRVEEPRHWEFDISSALTFLVTPDE